ncbi:MAG: SUMF1/EgtB/PvdO family nonheme iron enzyme [Planctomycetes bacterium]|nr:SUMF1/EgtB/PvdO family nonheme iron enzyme [Planctomycetota bacterium]
MAHCPACGKENPDELKLCRECGTRLPAREVPPAAPDPDRSLSLSAERTLRPEAALETGPGAGADPSLTLSDQRTLRGAPGGPAVAATATAPAAAGRYRVIAKAGQGGMGVVWKAEDLRFSPPRVVALKRLLGSDASNRGAIARFLQEAGAVAQLNHINIVTVFDVGEDSEGHYIVMEYVEGKPLTDLIREKGKLPVEDAVKLLRGIGNALSYAHRKRVVHRDVKPGNVLVTHDGTPKVLDFGLARVGGGSELSVSGYGMGTVDYASPEQKRDAKAADHRSDIYSLGATMYHMLTGDTPRTIRSDRLPPGLDQVVLKCLEERPEDRYFSVDELLGDLEKAASGKGLKRKVVLEEEPEGTCVACGFLNKPEARFCKKCGAGLFGQCVRCKKEIRAGSEHCIHCGVSVPKAKKVEEHLKQAKDHFAAQRYARALKELELLLEVEPKNPEGQRLRQEALGRQEKARQLREEGLGLVAKEEYERAGYVLKEYLELAPEDGEVPTIVGGFPAKIAERDCRRAEKLESEGNVAAALERYAGVLAKEPGAERAREGRKRVEQRRTKRRRVAMVAVSLGMVGVGLGVGWYVMRTWEVGRLLKDLTETMIGAMRGASGTALPSAGPSGATFTNSIGMVLRRIEPGEYLMGSPPGEEGRGDDESQHRVKITRPFYLGVTEVTQAEWRAVTGTSPSRFQGDKLPVEQVSWEDAKELCRKLSEREGKRYRLPTEAEWEYACRAGTATPFHTGGTIGTSQANYDGSYTYGSGQKGVYREKTVAVGSFPPNAWGLHDMHGNVWEWCEDWYGAYPQGEVTDPRGPSSGVSRVLRGGSWDSDPRNCRSANRYRIEPGFRNDGIGFRLALDF